MKNIRVGIDKATVKGFEIIKVDKDKLLSNNNVIYKNEKPSIVIGVNTDNKVFEYSYLRINDGNIFNSLGVGIKANEGYGNIYSFIDLHIGNEDMFNLEPLTIGEYHSLLERLKSYLKERYGLYIDFTKAKFGEIEISVTAVMNRPFIEYEYLLSQIVYLVPKRYSYTHHANKKKAIIQFDFYNKSIKGKIYGEISKLNREHNINVQKHYMRIEYTLCTTKKIKSSLGTDNIYSVNDNIIKEWITSQITKDLIEPIYKHIDEANKELIVMAQQEKINDERKWTRYFLYKALSTKCNERSDKLELVTDLEQIKDIIRHLCYKSNRKRTLDRLSIVEKNYLFAKDNFIKLDEIQHKFTALMEEY